MGFMFCVHVSVYIALWDKKESAVSYHTHLGTRQCGCNGRCSTLLVGAFKEYLSVFDDIVTAIKEN